MLFEVLLRQSYFDQEVLNRWHYNSAGTPAAVSLSFGLLSAFGGIPDGVTGEFPNTSIMGTLAACQSSSLQYVELQVTALYDVSDFYAVPYGSGQHGLAGGTPMSRFYAYALQSNRVRTDIRRGNKRLAGVSEDYVGSNGVVSGGVVAVLEALAERMTDPLTYDDEGNTLTYTPAILSFEEYAPSPGRVAYRPYPTLAEQLEHAAVGITWQLKPLASTQNSRK